ncbi:hypothetical protein Clacol_008404 [Clathrus columnatus]|uniref:Ribosomal RNA-processing protein 42 n=1 Tax=Clathrus columnatus TaxID=1419009 RepID=A0AAV5AHP3_9AGAM|nr:hypothetical protein Clacol_008404 [Clathrus columnatus]
MTSKSEKSYIQVSLTSELPTRSDGRGLLDYRTIQLEIGTIAQSNGSARVCLGGTEVVAASRLEVENTVDGGRIDCHNSSPAAYPRLSSSALDDLQYDFGELLNSVLGDKSLRPSNLTILPGQKAWCLNLDFVILSDAGNIYDALFIVAKAVLSNTRVPLTSPIEFKPLQGASDIVMDDAESALDTRRRVQAAADFELKDYWDEGEVLSGGEDWPLSSTHFLDATLQEEEAILSRLLGVRLMGAGEVVSADIKSLIQTAERYAQDLCKLLNTKVAEMFAADIAGFDVKDIFSGSQKFRIIIIVWSGVSSVTDITLAVTLLWYLKLRRTGYVTMETGLIIAIWAFIDLVLYLIFTRYLVFDLPLKKLYANSLMSTLNSRDRWRYDIENDRRIALQKVAVVESGISMPNGSQRVIWTGMENSSNQSGYSHFGNLKGLPQNGILVTSSTVIHRDRADDEDQSDIQISEDPTVHENFVNPSSCSRLVQSTFQSTQESHHIPE